MNRPCGVAIVTAPLVAAKDEEATHGRTDDRCRRSELRGNGQGFLLGKSCCHLMPFVGGGGGGGGGGGIM